MNAHTALKFGDPMPKLYPLSKSALRELVRPSGRDWILVGDILPSAAKHEPTREEGPLAWYVVMTNPRCEQRAQTGLIDKGFAVYFPQYREERIIRGRFCIVGRSLFSRYIFVRAPYGSWPRITSTDGVQALVRDCGISGAPLKISDEAVNAILDLQMSGAFDNGRKPLPHVLSKGQRVRVVKGAFSTFEAVVEEALAGKNVDIFFDLFGRAHKISIPLDHLESL